MVLDMERLKNKKKMRGMGAAGGSAGETSIRFSGCCLGGKCLRRGSAGRVGGSVRPERYSPLDILQALVVGQV